MAHSSLSVAPETSARAVALRTSQAKSCLAESSCPSGAGKLPPVRTRPHRPRAPSVIIVFWNHPTIQRVRLGWRVRTPAANGVSAHHSLLAAPLSATVVVVSVRIALAARVRTRPRLVLLSLCAVLTPQTWRRRLTTQAQRPGPRGRPLATGTRWPGSLQRMVRRSSAPATHGRLRCRTVRRAAHRRRLSPARAATQAARTGDPLPLSRDARPGSVRGHGGVRCGDA